ncbi:MAG: hypothetical protein WBM35_11730 [Candidatus Electrothrix sp.]|jgi:hypothetical protein|nr:hypothetical protein [bacterium]
MAKSIGEFQLNHTGNTYTKNEDGVVTAHASYEGSASGFGTVMGTMSFPLAENGATSGSCSWAGQAFQPDSTSTSSSGEGTWEQVEGKHAWKTSVAALKISDGRVLSSQGEIDLEARTFNGQMFEAS